MADDEQVDLDRTEPQRRALEEMSQALLERLNVMVREQEERAQDFAQRTHSLSALPEVPVPPEVPYERVEAEPEVKYEQVAAEPEVREPRKKAAHAAVQVPPLVRKMVAPEKEKPAYREPAPAAPRRVVQPKKKEEEGSVGAGVIVTIIGVLIVLLRSCG